MKRPQELLSIKKSLSRMLDTLALEMVITDIDPSCQGLLDILQWREQNTISSQEFSQLYSVWISDRGIINQLQTKQTATFQKQQLVNLLGSTLLKGQKVRHFLDLLRKQYINAVVKIGILSQGMTERINLIQGIFNELDYEEVGCLRRSHLLTVVEGLIWAKMLQLKHLNAEQVLKEVQNVESTMSGVNGVISFRNFTNGLLKYQPTLAQLKSFSKCINNLKSSRQPINVFDSAISKCRTLPAFKKPRQFDIIRLFEEHQSLFTESGSDSYSIESKLQRIYGSQYLLMKDIDFIVIQQLLEVVRKQTLNKISTILKTCGNNFRNRQSMERQLSPRNISGMKTKYSNKTQPGYVSKTPRRLLSTINTTPKKQLMSPFEGGNTNQLRTYRHTSKSMSKKYSNEEEKMVRVKSKSPMNKMRSPKMNTQEFMSYHHFFKNRRVQSFEVVMKRLKMMRK